MVVGSRLACPNCPTRLPCSAILLSSCPGHIFLIFDGCPLPAVLTILSSLSCPGWPVKADLSGRPVQTDLSRLPSPSCLVPDVLFVLLTFRCPVLSLLVIFWPSCPGCCQFRLSCPVCPAPTVLPWLSLSRLNVPDVLSHLSCPCCHVMFYVLCTRLYCRGCPATVVPSRLSCPSCPVLAVMCKTICPLFYVLLN
jgi:hypothetical protein